MICTGSPAGFQFVSLVCAARRVGHAGIEARGFRQIAGELSGTKISSAAWGRLTDPPAMRATRRHNDLRWCAPSPT